MYKVSFISFLRYSVLITILLCGQSYSQAFYLSWNKSFGNETHSYSGHDLICTQNNEFIITGSKLADNYDLIVIKTDKNGEKIWEKEFGGPGDESARSIAADSSGNFIVVGKAVPFGSNAANSWVLKIDTNGDTLHTKNNRI